MKHLVYDLLVAAVIVGAALSVIHVFTGCALKWQGHYRETPLRFCTRADERLKEGRCDRN